MLDLLAEVESDLSVYHRVEEMERMPGPRFARLVPLLPAYGGAVAAALAPGRSAAGPTHSPLVAVPPTSTPGRAETIVGTRTAIQLSEHSDLFEFAGGPSV